jgi:hypothetical protein
VGLNSLGEPGHFITHDGSNPTYISINQHLNSLEPREMLITVFACYSDQAVGDLKEGPSPRVVADINSHWFYGTLKNYQSILGFSIQGVPEPRVFDIDKNGYVSVGESLRTAIKYQVESTGGVTIADKDNIAWTFYLGDFKVQG